MNDEIIPTTTFIVKIFMITVSFMLTGSSIMLAIFLMLSLHLSLFIWQCVSVYDSQSQENQLIQHYISLDNVLIN